MGVSEVRAELVCALEESLRLLQQLTDDARDPHVPPPHLVAQVSVLERLDDRRDHLINELRRQASAGVRATRPGATVRLSVLSALTELRWPQNAGFLERYLWATRQIQVDSRAFAPLRRDEQRAWLRGTGGSRSYVAPALNPDGTANPRWLTNSRWELGRRIVACDRTERLFDLQKILSLVGRDADSKDQGPMRGPLDALLEQYSERVLGIEAPAAWAGPQQSADWRSRVRHEASMQIRAIREGDDTLREQIAARLASMSEHDRVWGRRPAR